MMVIPRSSSSAAEAVPVIIDTDMGSDDWMAILYLLQHSGVSVQAITVTGAGMAHCQDGVRIAQGLLMLAEKPSIPVACGRETPLSGDHTFPDEWRRDSDKGMGIPLPENPNPASELTAVDLMLQTLDSIPALTRIIALGPLTNLAEALAVNPSLMQDKVLDVWIMGGAVEVEGNLYDPVSNGFINPHGEYNIWVDPLAAQQVFASDLRLNLIPLDVTNRVPITMEFVKTLDADHASPAADFVHRVITQNHDFMMSGGYFFWDPLAVVIATDPTIATFQEFKLGVVTEEGEESGRTKIMLDGRDVHVAVAVDEQRFKRFFLDVLNRRLPMDS